MKKIVLWAVIALFLAACNQDNEKNNVQKEIEEAFRFRFENVDVGINRTKKILERPDINEYRIAQIHNNLAYLSFLKSDCVSAGSHLDSVAFYLNRCNPRLAREVKIEEVFSKIITAQIFQRWCEFDSTAYILKSKDLRDFDKHIAKNERHALVLSEFFRTNLTFAYYYKSVGSVSGYQEILNWLPILNANKLEKHLDSLQLSLVCYLKARVYLKLSENKMNATKNNYLKSLEYVDEYLTSFWDMKPANNYSNANLLELLGQAFQFENAQFPENRAMKSKIDSLLNAKLNIKNTNDSLFIFAILQKSGEIFEECGDPYQKLSSKVETGKYFQNYREQDSIAYVYYNEGIKLEPILASLNARPPKLLLELYTGLTETGLEKHVADPDYKRWFAERNQMEKEIKSKEKADIILTVQQDRDEKKRIMQHAIIFSMILLISIGVIFVLFYTNAWKKHKTDFANLSQIMPKISSELTIDGIDKTTKFMEALIDGLHKCNLFEKFHDLSFILYKYSAKENKLERICVEKKQHSEVLVNDYSLVDLSAKEFPAVGCFLKSKEMYDFKQEEWVFHNWYFDYKKYALKMGIDPNRIKVEKPISGHDTYSLLYAPLKNKKGEPMGVLSFQTIKPNAFKKGIYIDFFQIVAQNVQVALDNAMQYKNIEQMNQQLKQVNNEMIIFHSIISHDVYNRVVRLRQMVDELLEFSLHKEMLFPLASLSKGTEEMLDKLRQRAINHKKDIATALLSPNIVSVSLPKLQAKLEEYIIKQNENTLYFDFPENCRKIEADEVMLETILRNLIDNAMKHTMNGTIKVYSQLGKNQVEIFVEDTGEGLNEEQFEKCRTLFSENKGLGLFIVNKLVKAHNGNFLLVPNNDTKGTILCISIPQNNN